MVRTQIRLTEEQARRLRAASRQRGISLAEAIRRYVDQGLQRERPSRSALYARAATLVGRFRDRGAANDVAREHDRYLEDAYE